MTLLVTSCSSGGKQSTLTTARTTTRGPAGVASGADDCTKNPGLLCPLQKGEQYAWYNLGVIDQRAGNTRKATSDYLKAITIQPNFEAALYNLGVIRLQARDYIAAVTSLTRAVALNPKDANAHWELGIALTHLHTAVSDERARVELNKALKLHPLVKGTPPTPPTCPPHPTAPSFVTTYCGPTPGPGNGDGPSGECTGRESAPPCGPGMMPDHYYAYTLPGRCDGRLVLNGERWRSELPPATPVPDLYGWVKITASGKGAGWMGPQGAIGLDPDTEQRPSACTTTAPTAPATTE